MPYSGPVAVARPGHRRSTSLFSDEKGSGTFQPLGSLPRRTPKTGGAMFHFRGDDDDSSSSSHSDNDDDHPPPLKINPNNTLRISLEPIPFPKASPLSPSPAVNSPTRPAYTRTSSTPVLLSNGKPLKSSLKSSSSSPNIPNIPVVQFPQIVRSLHLRARSAPSTPSLDMSSVIAASCPSTPKNVHFSSDLEDVRVFNRTAKPASVSRPPGDETETETENENARDWSGRIENKFFPSAFPFPRLPDPAPLPPNQKRPFQLDSSSYPVPNPSPSSSANVHLESLTLTATEPPSLTGSVLVKNVCFEKHVYLRFTLDDWQTTSEVGTKYVASLTDLPPTFVPRTFGDMLVASSSTDTPPTWDRFEFSIRLEDYLAHLDSKTLWLVVRYTAPGTGEWWDNNGGRNYRVMFKRGELKERSISAPSAPPSTLQASTVAPPVVSKPFSAQSPSRSPQLQQALSLATTQRLSKFSLKNYAKPTGPVSVPGSTPTNMSPTTPKSELVVNLIGPTPTQDKQQMPRTRSSPPSSSDTTPMPSPGLEAPPPSVDAQVLSASLPPLKTQPLTRNSENGTFTGLQWGWTAPRSPSPDRSPLSPDTPSSLVSSIGGLKPPAGLHPTKRSPPPLAIPPVPALDRSRTSSGSTSSSDSLSSLEDNFRELAVRLASPPRVPSPQIRAQSGQLSPPQGESPVLSPVLQHPHPQKTLQTLHALRTSPVPSPLSGSPVNSGDAEIPGDVTPPVSASEAESMYKAFVRQWCFATTQNTPPATIVEGLTGITA